MLKCTYLEDSVSYTTMTVYRFFRISNEILIGTKENETFAQHLVASIDKKRNLWNVKSIGIEAEEIALISDNGSLLKVCLFRGLSKPSLICNSCQKVIFHKNKLFAFHQQDTTLICSLKDNWNLEDDVYNAIQISTDYENFCPACGNICPVEWRENGKDFCQCQRCNKVY